MKYLLPCLTLGGLLTAASLQAQIDFYITGSTAFRANTYRAIRTMYPDQGGTLTSQNPADNSGAAANSNVVTFAGSMPTSFGSTPLFISTPTRTAEATCQQAVLTRLRSS